MIADLGWYGWIGELIKAQNLFVCEFSHIVFMQFDVSLIERNLLQKIEYDRKMSSKTWIFHCKGSLMENSFIIAYYNHMLILWINIFV